MGAADVNLRVPLRAIALALPVLAACQPSSWSGTWGSRLQAGVPDTTVTVSCPASAAQMTPTNVTLQLDQCAVQTFELQFTSGSDAITCTGPAPGGNVVMLDGTPCSGEWAIAEGTLVQDAYPFVNGMQARVSGSAIVGGASCSFTITGPLYFESPGDNLCEDGGS
jgi:hypothetical protein